jgi:DNA-binding IclR family transcriptional regulator
VLYVDQVSGQSALQAHNWVGQHIPLHATSNGKVLLSGLSLDEVDSRLPRLPSYTPGTVTTKAKLRRDLAVVREQGYAVAVDELEVGLTALAAPIRNAHGDVIASLSVSGPTFRLNELRVKELVPVVLDAADEVSRRLGYGSS